ncbi:MAG: hypothetical protein R2795_25685 [Saprospiraceae bacterium]
MKNALLQGIHASLRHWRTAAIFYLASLLLAVVATWPFHALLEKYAGHSLMLDDLIKGFNYTFLNDFLQNYGAGFTPVLHISLFVLLLWLPLLAFLSGGALHNLITSPEGFQRPLFWSGAGLFFGRLFRLTLLFLFVHAVVLWLFGMVYWQAISGFSRDVLDDTRVVASSLYWWIPLYVLLGGIFFLWQDVAVVELVRSKSSVLHAMGVSARILRKQFRLLYPVYLIWLLVLLLLMVIRFTLTASLDIQDGATLLLFFLLTQLFVLARFMVKIGTWKSVYHLIA